MGLWEIELGVSLGRARDVYGVITKKPQSIIDSTGASFSTRTRAENRRAESKGQVYGLETSNRAKSCIGIVLGVKKTESNWLITSYILASLGACLRPANLDRRNRAS
jgi:hypothetical protein